MSWETIGTIVVWGIDLYVFVELLRFFENNSGFFENNSENWQRLDHIERMLQELTKKDEDKPKD